MFNEYSRDRNQIMITLNGMKNNVVTIKSNSE